MADIIERRRELLERLVGRIDRWLNGRVLIADKTMLRCMRDMITGALEIGNLGDDGAWMALLEMVLEEVVDDGRDE